MDSIILTAEGETFYLDKSKCLRPHAGLRNAEHEAVLCGGAGGCKPSQRVIFFLIRCEVSMLKKDWKKILGLC